MQIITVFKGIALAGLIIFWLWFGWGLAIFLMG
jgi:hypothetical protein